MASMGKATKSLFGLTIFCIACWMAATKSCPKHQGLQGTPAQVASLRSIIFISNGSAKKRERAVIEYAKITKQLGKETDLREADLVGLDLSGADLSSANL